MTSGADTRELADAFAAAKRVADAVLFEGYLLYPYRSSAQKNRIRWQFGVLAPPAWSQAGGGDPSASRTETLLEGDDDAVLQVRLRCLQLETTSAGWDEGVEQEVDALVGLGPALGAPQVIPFRLDGGEARSGGRMRQPIGGRLRVSAARLPGPYGVVRLRVDVENTTDWDPSGGGESGGVESGGVESGGVRSGGREEATRHSLVSSPLLVGAAGGSFLSLTDPPEWARPAAEGCVNEHTWPILLGGVDGPAVVLSSPIILPDQAEVAPESPGDLFDATEIDEILTLRTLVLTEEEKREARATDPRAAAIVDRTENLPAEVWERLHGAVRGLRPVASDPAGSLDFDPAGSVDPDPAGVPWWDPGADASFCPDTDAVDIAGVAVARGHRVRLHPGRAGRADAQDMFLAGRVANVEAVLHDVDGGTHVAVRLEDDPAPDLVAAHGRFLYFHPDEIEPL